MTNQEFIAMLACCGKIETSETKIMQELAECEIDLSKAYREICGLIKENNSMLSSDTLILNTFHTILNHYKRADKTKEECFNEFIELLKLKFNILCEGNIQDLYILASGGINAIPLFRDLRFFKIKTVEKGSMIVLNGKPSLCSFYYNESKNIMQFYIDRKQTNIGGVFIKDDVENYFKVENVQDSCKLMIEIIKGDYDLALVPSLRMLKNINNHANYRFNNFELLEYVTLTLPNSSKIDDATRKAYSIVADYDINLKALLDYIYHWRALEASSLMVFLASIIEKIKGLDREDRKQYLKEINRILFVKLNMIASSNIQNYGNKHFENMSKIFKNKELDCWECLEAIKKEKKSNVMSVFYHGSKRHEEYALLEDRVEIDKNGLKDVVPGDYKIMIDRDRDIHVFISEEFKNSREYLLLVE